MNRDNFVVNLMSEIFFDISNDFQDIIKKTILKIALSHKR